MIRLVMMLAAAVAMSTAGGTAHAKMAMQTFPVLAGAGAHDVYPAPDRNDSRKTRSRGSGCKGGIKNAGTPSRTASNGAYRLVARRGIGCERRHPFDGEPGAGCRGGAWESQQRVARGGRGPGRWGYVDGCG